MIGSTRLGIQNSSYFFEWIPNIKTGVCATRPRDIRHLQQRHCQPGAAVRADKRLPEAPIQEVEGMLPTNATISFALCSTCTILAEWFT